MTSSAQTLVNTVNTVGVMGKGLAAAFKERYPDMYEAYKTRCDADLLKPGSIWIWKGADQWVLNFSTKKHWRKPSQLEYIRNGLLEIRASYEALGIREIAFPRLGCGNGGLNWTDVRPIMIEMLHDLPIAVFIHDYEKKLGKLEHELPLMQQLERAATFEEFYKDLEVEISKREGKINSIVMNSPFYVSLDENCELRDASGCNKLLATEDDLFRIWSLLSVSSVSRFDLPDTAQDCALKVFSVISQLSYVRPVNLANRHGRNNLALEYIRSSIPLASITTSVY